MNLQTGGGSASVSSPQPQRKLHSFRNWCQNFQEHQCVLCVLILLSSGWASSSGISHADPLPCLRFIHGASVLFNLQVFCNMTAGGWTLVYAYRFTKSGIFNTEQKTTQKECGILKLEAQRNLSFSFLTVSFQILQAQSGKISRPWRMQ